MRRKTVAVPAALDAPDGHVVHRRRRHAHECEPLADEGERPLDASEIGGDAGLILDTERLEPVADAADVDPLDRRQPGPQPSIGPGKDPIADLQHLELLGVGTEQRLEPESLFLAEARLEIAAAPLRTVSPTRASCRTRAEKEAALPSPERDAATIRSARSAGAARSPRW